MMPFQIMCDYLEDKGVNTVLLRTLEPEGIHATTDNDMEGWNGKSTRNSETLSISPDGYGSGYLNGSHRYGDGSGSGWSNLHGDGIGFGIRYGSGWGTFEKSCIQAITGLSLE